MTDTAIPAEAPEAVPFALRNTYNPDVLTCIANLSSDEVFTPPEFAYRMLDTLADGWAASNGGANIWADSTVTFLDPFTKSGVFLREIVKRLVEGLEDEIPDLQKRVEHILSKQVFGIGITQLTSLLARRSLYCSKTATGEYSIGKNVFDDEDGNIWFERIEHTWVGGRVIETADKKGKPVLRTEGGRCKYCRSPQVTLDRGSDAETYAYPFIHTDDIKARLAELFGEDMQFDVIIGNPPYQTKGGGGGTNDSPIYQLFVQQAQRLEPRFLSMVIPSRWMAGGRGLSEFRAEMLCDKRTRVLVDYENAKDAFPTIGIIGGVCYFLWDRDNPGRCLSTYIRNEAVVGPQERELGEFDVYVRDPRAVSILRKVQVMGEPTLDAQVSGDTPFGLATNFTQYERGTEPRAGQLRIYANVGTTRVQGAVPREMIGKNTHLIDTWKLFLPVAGSGRERERSGVDIVLGPSIVAAPGTVCTQTYLVAGPLASEVEAESVSSYLRTRLARFLVSLRKPSQHVFRGMYRWVPTQSWDQTWTDEKLHKKYGLTVDEIAFIESIVRPMEIAG